MERARVHDKDGRKFPSEAAAALAVHVAGRAQQPPLPRKAVPVSVGLRRSRCAAGFYGLAFKLLLWLRTLRYVAPAA